MMKIIEVCRERAKHMPKNVGFEVALKWIKEGDRANREGWKGRRKWIELSGGKKEIGILSHLIIVYLDGTISPWTPTRCDILENDWNVLPDPILGPLE